jgi:hypothetical protein
MRGLLRSATSFSALADKLRWHELSPGHSPLAQGHTSMAKDNSLISMTMRCNDSSPLRGARTVVRWRVVQGDQ